VWRATIVEQRSQVDRLIADSPRADSPRTDRRRRRRERDRACPTPGRGETPHIALNQLDYADTDVLGDWFPIEA
jgi:hypothetical protein